MNEYQRRSLKQQHTAVVKIYVVVYHYNLGKLASVCHKLEKLNKRKKNRASRADTSSLRTVKAQNGNIPVKPHLQPAPNTLRRDQRKYLNVKRIKQSYVLTLERTLF